MRKLLSLICIFAILLASAFNALANTDIVLYVGQESANPNERVIIPIALEVNPGIAIFDLNIEYDSSKLRLDGVTQGSALESFMFAPPALRNPLTVGWISFDFVNEASTGTLLELEFTILPTASAGTAYINVTGVAFAISENGEDLVVVSANQGYVTVLREDEVAAQTCSLLADKLHLWRDAHYQYKRNLRD